MLVWHALEHGGREMQLVVVFRLDGGRNDTFADPAIMMQLCVILAQLAVKSRQ